MKQLLLTETLGTQLEHVKRAFVYVHLITSSDRMMDTAMVCSSINNERSENLRLSKIKILMNVQQIMGGAVRSTNK